MTEKYISSAWLLETIEDYKNISCWNIKRLPAADVAEVVRCKYCRHLGAPLSGGCYDCKKIYAAVLQT